MSISKRRRFHGTRAALVVGTFALALLNGSPARADVPKPGSFEINISASRFMPMLESAYSSRFSPPYRSGTYESSAAQDLAVKGRGVFGLSASAAYFLTTGIGFQLVVDIMRPSVEGINSNYEYSLDYHHTPSAGAPYSGTYSDSRTWPDSEGSIRETAIGLNAVVRFPVTRAVTMQLSGGPAYFAAEGKIGYLGYTEFWTAEGLLHIRNYELGYEFNPISRLGFDAGAEIAFDLMRSVALMAEFRYFACPKSDAAIKLSRDEAISVTEIESIIAPGPMKIDPSYARFSAGVKIRF
jgi:hypothetical protein